MDYATFKTYLAEFLWKPNDTSLIAALDNLIIMGTSELGRKLDITRREDFFWYIETVAGLNTPINLPADFKQIRTVQGECGVFVSATAQQASRASIKYTGPLKPLYHVSFAGDNTGWTLQMVGSIAVGDRLGIGYRNKLPDFAVTDTSWVADDYLDLYTYTILKHCAPFLREDERIPVWQQYAIDALASVLEEDRHNIQYGGADGAMSPPRAASGPRYPSRRAGGYGASQP